MRKQVWESGMGLHVAPSRRLPSPCSAGQLIVGSGSIAISGLQTGPLPTALAKRHLARQTYALYCPESELHEGLRFPSWTPVCGVP